MNVGDERVLYYHADASPIGGSLTHPHESALNSHASISLSQSGGHGAARVENFKLDNLIHSGAAYSQVSGSVEKKTRNWTTLITSVIENLNVHEVVTADRIVAHLAIEHPREGYYPKVAFAGCLFENLRISGKPITPKIDLGLLSSIAPEHAARSVKKGDKLSSKTAPAQTGFPDKPWPDVQSFVKKAVDQSIRITSAKGVPKWLKHRYEWMESPEARNRKGYILCSLVNDVPGAASDSSFGHVIVVPGFGNIFLGELIVSTHSFQLAMLRVEMSSTATGHLSFSVARGNGFPMP